MALRSGQVVKPAISPPPLSSSSYYCFWASVSNPPTSPLYNFYDWARGAEWELGKGWQPSWSSSGFAGSQNQAQLALTASLGSRDTVALPGIEIIKQQSFRNGGRHSPFPLPLAFPLKMWRLVREENGFCFQLWKGQIYLSDKNLSLICSACL